MKNIIATCFFLFGFLPFVNAQSVNGIPISNIDAEYIQIIGTPRAFSNKLRIDIDFGQLDKVFDVNDTRIEDAQGKVVKFNSMMEALNFMDGLGYELIETYPISVQNGEDNIINFILRKKKGMETIKE